MMLSTFVSRIVDRLSEAIKAPDICDQIATKEAITTTAFPKSDKGISRSLDRLYVVCASGGLELAIFS